MNRNLFALAMLLILLGVGFNAYLISFFGVLLLIPTFVSPNRAPTRPAPSPASTSQRQWRVVPPPSRQPEPVMHAPHAVAAPAPAVAPPPQQQTPTYAPALFPTAMFPAMLGMTGIQPQPQIATPAAKPQGQDELLEVGALLALLKLAFG